MTIPTVGRIVWYYASIAQAEPLPATVCKVTAHENEEASRIEHTLNLAAFSEEGHPFNRKNVILIQANDPRPNGEHCIWMPYQIAQAAKQAALSETPGEALAQEATKL